MQILSYIYVHEEEMQIINYRRNKIDFISVRLMMTPNEERTLRATYHLLEMHNTVKDILNSPWLLTMK